ncbi:MAG: helix-turn-helix transcriptional regulator [Bacteriovoracaceae bacterium]|nr:helix-turn-helix transcriptional regulator [Bacteroidota bacterium]MBL6991853.1 helix-turn-helix transcriptional regulator [Bacteriovoracaceae bacterium]
MKKHKATFSDFLCNNVQNGYQYSKIIRASRKRMGLDIESLAKKINVSPCNIKKWENEGTPPNIIEWVAFCDAFSLDIDCYCFDYIDFCIPLEAIDLSNIGLFTISKRYSHKQGFTIRWLAPFIKYFEYKYGSKKLDHFCSDKNLDSDYLFQYDNQLNFNFFTDLLREILKGEEIGVVAREISMAVGMSQMHGLLSCKYIHSTKINRLFDHFINETDKYTTYFSYEKVENFNNKTYVNITPAQEVASFIGNDTFVLDFLKEYQKSWCYNFPNVLENKPNTISVTEIESVDFDQQEQLLEIMWD